MHDVGQAGLHGLCVRPDLGLFADQGDVGIGQGEAAGAGAVHGVDQELGAVGVFPCGLGGGEVAADVTICQSAIDGVGQGVHADVCIRVALQRAVVL